MDEVPEIGERVMVLQPTWSGVVRGAAFYGLIILLPVAAFAALTGVWGGALVVAAGLTVLLAFMGFAKVLRRASLSIDDDGLVIRGVLGTTGVRWAEAERVERRGPRREQVWIWQRARADGKRPDQVVITPYLYGRSAEEMFQLIEQRVSARADLA